MSSSRTESVSGPGGDNRAATLGALADQIASDTQTYARYGYEMSNEQRSDYVCRAVGIPHEQFSLLLPFPFDEWLVSDDVALLRSGIFLLDMRCSAYKAARAKLGASEEFLFAEQAEDEFMGMHFIRRLRGKQFGEVFEDTRLLQ